MPGGLRRGSADVRLLGLLVRIPPGAWMSLVAVMPFQVEVCALGWSFVQRSPTECDRRASITRSPCPTGGLLCQEGRGDLLLCSGFTITTN